MTTRNYCDIVCLQPKQSGLSTRQGGERDGV
nr:MAG TPA: hypothetical protein [Caudoviricetes sp.]